MKSVDVMRVFKQEQMYCTEEFYLLQERDKKKLKKINDLQKVVQR